jgi:DNA adenine methylase
MSAMPKTTALFHWFGSNRMLAHAVGEELSGCGYVGVVFAGGLSELLHIDARSLGVNDLHRHSINCARVAADPVLGPKFYRRVRRQPFAGDVLEAAQARCLLREKAQDNAGLFGAVPDPNLFDRFEWAVDYWIAIWMGRGGKAGTDSEFSGGLSVRFNGNGGDSATRYHSAGSSLPAWRSVLRRANFTTLDCFEFLRKIKDEAGNGVYSDAPWPGAGDSYRHKFDEAKQRRLARMLGAYERARVVVRFGDHPLIRELYPEPKWTWRMLSGRNQANDGSSEVLLMNGPSRAAKLDIQ